MKVSFHLGGHFANRELLARTLHANEGPLKRWSVLVGNPAVFHSLIEAANQECEIDDPTLFEDLVLVGLANGEEPERLVISDELFLSHQRDAFLSGQLYCDAGRNTSKLRKAFPDHDVEFFLATRNMATFIPLWLRRMRQEATPELAEFLIENVPSWAEVVSRIQFENPTSHITVWKQEDAPVMWGTILRSLCGLTPDVRLNGEFSLFKSYIPSDTFAKIKGQVEATKRVTVGRQQIVLSRLMQTFSSGEPYGASLGHTILPQKLTARLTAAYNRDFSEIRNLPNVSILEPAR